MADFGQGYVGTGQDVQRIRRMEKQREEQKKKFDALRKQGADKIEAAGLRSFGTSVNEAAEAAFRTESVGLVSRDEFIRLRTTVQERLEEELRQKQREESEAMLKNKELRRKMRDAGKPKLSFMADEEEENGDDDSRSMPPPPPVLKALASSSSSQAKAEGEAEAAPAASSAGQGQGQGSGSGSEQPESGSNGEVKAEGAGGATDATAAAGPSSSSAAQAGNNKPRYGKLGKDPTVLTDFLPDKDREAQEEELRKQLRKEWLAQQEAARNEPLEITYSYWNGTGHRRKVTVRKGDSVAAFLKAVRDQCAPEFRELRSTSVDNLIYIKEDVILPQHYTFYDLIINKARGKSGPLFDFGVTEDIRIVNDASREKEDSHAGKVVERHWYERNKHIFPANRWEMYDPEKKYDTYTIHDYVDKH